MFVYIANELRAENVRFGFCTAWLNYERCDVQQNLVKAVKSSDERNEDDENENDTRFVARRTTSPNTLCCCINRLPTVTSNARLSKRIHRDLNKPSIISLLHLNDIFHS